MQLKKPSLPALLEDKTGLHRPVLLILACLTKCWQDTQMQQSFKTYSARSLPSNQVKRASAGFVTAAL